ncbi:MAG: tRNA pseudouridine(13) synthase TruD, partial [Deltaproteobacteria bacterium]|nr:tRNA pseudouridine(13) synthase TruD [Deltaproteobacteria bacterium]
ALEQAAIAAAGLDEADLAALARYADGTRRDLVVFPGEPGFEAPAPGELVLRFSLPAGSYATELVRQLTHAPPGEDRTGGGGDHSAA